MKNDCPVCGEELNSVNQIQDICAVCGKEFCDTCAGTTCITCGKILCINCAQTCQTCFNVYCEEHLKMNDVCINC